MIPETVLEDCIQERDAAIKVIAAAFSCDDSRVKDIIKLIHRHGAGIIEHAGIFLDANCSTDWDFAAIVEGVQVQVLNVIEPDINEGQHYRLGDVDIDTSAGVGNWKVHARGEAREDEAKVFTDMCQHGIFAPALELLQRLQQSDKPDAKMNGFYMALTIGFQGLPDDVRGDILLKGMGSIKPENPDFLIFDPKATKTEYEDGGRTLHIAYPRLERDKVYVKLDDYGTAEVLSENVGRKVNTQYAVTFMLQEER